MDVAATPEKQMRQKITTLHNFGASFAMQSFGCCAFDAADCAVAINRTMRLHDEMLS
jgi:hypothetical protein